MLQVVTSPVDMNLKENQPNNFPLIWSIFVNNDFSYFNHSKVVYDK